MNMQELYSGFWGRSDAVTAAFDYGVDVFQRCVLYNEIMRKRGNMYLEHVEAGQPPVLVFDYDVVMDGREMERPVNYAMLRIIDRRESKTERRKDKERKAKERRADGKRTRYDPPDPDKRPIVVIDPRAGHGPGIGGSKFDSQVGVALDAGHPVYFVMFYPDPVPGQTLADVQQAEVQFLEEVIRRHPTADLPAVIGNCQAGWATALIGADRPDVTGPMVFNGSPLSYWGGVDGANPMRYRGGLYGGIWLTSLCCDLGNGQFDGAHLVAGFEELNPANTFWSKQYYVWSNVDTEEQRYLEFEKWWGGFFKMNRDEIHFIVDSLFVGNELEQGRLRLGDDRWINLKNFKDPIVVFASAGDNITPPQQALNWIYKVYKTVDEIKRNGQVIVYILHPRIGHLGIFVGSKVARKEHTAIIGTVDMIEYLSPGLYEMVITDEGNDPEQRQVEFAQRTMEDILKLDDGLEDEEAFNSVSAISKLNDKIYLTYFSPLVRSMVDDTVAEAVRQLHPLRMQRYMLSDLNPLMWPFEYMAPLVKENRRPVAEDNPFAVWEKMFSGLVTDTLNSYRDYRDQYHERLFKALYENDWMQALFPKVEKAKEVEPEPVHPEQLKIERKLWLELMQKGGFKAAIVRIILAVAAADLSIDQREFLVAQDIIQGNGRLNGLRPSQIKRLVKEQAAIVGYDLDEALKALPKLLPKKVERVEAFEIANSIAGADLEIHEKEQEVLDKIKKILRL